MIGLCQCGCGHPSSPATTTNRNRGWIKGQPNRYLPGHHLRKSSVDFLVQDMGFNTPCWVWQRAKTRNGYGSTWSAGQWMGAHVLYYTRKHGPVPNGMELDHLCRVRQCVNPDHLEPVTSAENIRRSPVAKLTANQVVDIKQRLQQGVANKVLAEDYGVSRPLISNIKRGVAWAEI